MVLEPGDKIGKYRIINNLGAGGMADVYLVEDSTNRRQLALKALPQELARDPERAARFQKEVEHLTSLEHPHIVSIHDVGIDNGCHYYAMTYLSGGNLKQCIRQGMSAEQALTVIGQIADALHFAHAKGLIHRDIKPENIIFNSENRAVLTDLGIVRALGSRTRMTKTGMSIGTPHYMSPEQARGKEVDGRSDIYSLGVVLYEMLTGNLPYDSEDTFAVAFQHVSDPLPELPQDLAVYQPLIDRMMAKDQKGRFADASVLLEAVSHLQAGRTIKRPVAATRVMESPQETKISRAKTEVRERIVEDYPTPQQKISWVGKNKWIAIFGLLPIFVLGGFLLNKDREISGDNAKSFIVAANAGDITQVEALLKRGIDVDVRDPDGNKSTALIRAAWGGHIDIVRLLVEYGADVNARCLVWGASALSLAVLQNHPSVVRLLLENGADPNTIGFRNRDRTYAAGAQAPVLIVAAEEGFESIINQLYRHGANINDRDRLGKTALIYAAERGNITTVRYLLKCGANVHAKDKNGSTALLIAIRNGNYEIRNLLIEHGARL